MAKELGCSRLMIYGDLELVVEQTMKARDALADNMIAYRDLHNMMEGDFEGCKLYQIGRESNEEADMLANLGSTKSQIPLGIFLERIEHRSIKPKRTTPKSPAQAKGKTPITDDLPIEVLLIEPTWTYPFLAYILHSAT